MYIYMYFLFRLFFFFLFFFVYIPYICVLIMQVFKRNFDSNAYLITSTKQVW